jgi:hypothetical protein
MLRLAVLATALLALAASTQDSYQFRQRGTVATPRAALSDGQPLTGPVALEGHAGATVSEEAQAVSAGPTQASGAAIARKQAGAALRFRAGQSADFGLEVDREWSPSKTTSDGVRVAAPDDAVVDVALAMRASAKVSDNDDLRIGFAFNLGGHSTPIVRGEDPTGDVQRDTSLLFRAAIVPSYRTGNVVFFGSLGLATESDVPASVFVTGGDDDPGVVAENSGAAFTMAAGARVDVGSGAHVTARSGDAVTDATIGHYGPQVDVALGFDVGK